MRLRLTVIRDSYGREGSGGGRGGEEGGRDARKRKCERDPRPRSVARRPTLTLFREAFFQTDADVMSRRCPRRT